MKYLRHVITAVPTNIIELRGFLGLTDYYNKFIRNYGLLSRALTDLLKKDNFHWGRREDDAFQHLKGAMSTTLVLTLSDFNKTFTIETDGSQMGVGAILTQEGKPLVFISQRLGVKN